MISGSLLHVCIYKTFKFPSNQGHLHLQTVIFSLHTVKFLLQKLRLRPYALLGLIIYSTLAVIMRLNSK